MRCSSLASHGSMGGEPHGGSHSVPDRQPIRGPTLPSPSPRVLHSFSLPQRASSHSSDMIFMRGGQVLFADHSQKDGKCPFRYTSAVLYKIILSSSSSPTHPELSPTTNLAHSTNSCRVMRYLFTLFTMAPILRNLLGRPVDSRRRDCCVVIVMDRIMEQGKDEDMQDIMW